MIKLFFVKEVGYGMGELDRGLAQRMARLQAAVEARQREQDTKDANTQKAQELEHDEGDLIDNSVTKSNALARAHYRFDLVEKRVMEALVSQLNPTITSRQQLQELELKAVDYAKTFGVSEKIAYRDLAKAVHGLMRTIITIKREKGKHEYNLMSDANYIDNEGKIICTFSPKIANDLVGLKKQFATYPLSQAVDFKSSYTWRLYEIMVSWSQDKKLTDGVFCGWFNISVDELREQMGMPKSYLWINLDRTLTTAIDELKAKASIRTSIERIKTSRKITHLKIQFMEDQQQQPR
jgi:plasmid replication initiation protein